MTSLVKEIDTIAGKTDLEAFVAFLGDSSETFATSLEELAAKNSLKIPLTIPVKEESVKPYKIADDSVLVVVLYQNKKIVKGISLKKEELNKAGIDSIVADVKKFVKK